MAKTQRLSVRRNVHLWCVFLHFPRGEIMGKSGSTRNEWTLDLIVAVLNEHHQRASYGAVAGVLKRLPIQLMQGRPHSRRDSWVVASSTCRKAGRRLGRPTHYSDREIHPVCLQQIGRMRGKFLRTKKELRQWLGEHLSA